MNKREFAQLEANDRFSFRGTIYTVTWAERYTTVIYDDNNKIVRDADGNTVRHTNTYSITTQDGRRAKIDDREVAEMILLDPEETA